MKKTSLRSISSVAVALLTGLLWPGNASAIVEIYNTQTNFNWVCPPGVTSLKVECWGGGGGGGSSLVDTNFTLANAGGGGGGGGAYAARFNVPVTPGNSYNVTIPAAATPTTVGFTNNQRFNGSAVSFTGDSATTVTAAGGGGGQCKITQGTALTGQNGAGGAAGVGYDAAWKGGTSTNWAAGNGGGGAGGAGDLGDGGNAAAVNGSFGAGGLGSDAAHTGGDGGAAKNGVGAGNNATSPGGGGGGAKSTTTSTGVRKGGNGGTGQIILTYTLPGLTPVVKANNTTNLNEGTSWVGGIAPGALGVATWNSTVTSPNTTVLGADVNWGGITIANPTGLVTINAGNTLTLSGFAITNIDLSTATADLTLNCGLALDTANVWDVQAGRTLTVGGAVSGTKNLTTQNAGTVILSSSANSYSGNTTVSAGGTLKLGAANVVPNGDGQGIVTVDGTLDLNTFSETLNGLSGAGTLDTVAGGTPTLTVGSTNYSATFTGIIQNTAGTLSLTKIGTGRQNLAGANTLSGPVLVNQGWLTVGESNAPLANVSSITVADGATFGAYGDQVDIDVPVTLGAGNPTINIVAPITPLNGGATTAQRPLRLNGGITGTGNVVFKGVNPYNWSGVINVSNCTYTGSTLMTCDVIPGITLTNNNNVIVQLLATNALPTTTVLTMDGDIGPEGASGFGRACDLFLNGFPQTLAGLTNVTRTLRAQRIINRDSQQPATLTINNSTDYTFSGWMGASSGGSLGTGNAGNNLDFVKTGSGTFTLSKTNGNTYANGTTINGGTLLVNNITGSGTGTGDVTVNSGGTLGGTGSIAGNVTVNAGGGIAPGASIGTLTVNGNLVLAAGSTNTFEVNGSTPTNDIIGLGAAVTYGGVLKIVPTGTITNGQTFTLFSGAGATDPSNFSSIESSSGTYSFANGVLTVVTAPVTGPSGPATLTNSFNGTMLSLSWPAGQNWRLQAQTNALSTGLSNNWVYVTSASVSSTNIPVDSTKPTVFYRLVYP
jgi:autotransporter-associated beta strand protein